MLKACWDCLGRNNELAKNEQNGLDPIRVWQNASPYPRQPNPQGRQEIMFILPKKLVIDDQITIYGTMTSNPRILTANLITGSIEPDYQNIACQLSAIFPSDTSDQNQVIISTIKNGQQEIINGEHQTILATELFTDLSFKFSFKITLNGGYFNEPMLDINVGESYLNQIQLKHNIDDIRFLSFDGDILKISKLKFEYA